MWLIDSETDLIEAMNKDRDYIKLIDKLTNIYLQRKEKEEFNITNKEVEDAVRKSIRNSVVWTKTFRKEFRHSQWLLSDFSAKEICQKQENTLNPLFYIFDDWEYNILVYSLFEDESLWLPWFTVKNWIDKNWRQKFRKSIRVSKPWRFYLNMSCSVKKKLYHPVVWYLLSNNQLQSYISEDFKKEMKSLIKDLAVKQNEFYNI